jgi:hypothetical protein
MLIAKCLESKMFDTALVVLGFGIIFGAFAVTPSRPIPPMNERELARLKTATETCEKKNDFELLEALEQSLSDNQNLLFRLRHGLIEDREAAERALNQAMVDRCVSNTFPRVVFMPTVKGH